MHIFYTEGQIRTIAGRIKDNLAITGVRTEENAKELIGFVNNFNFYNEHLNELRLKKGEPK